MPVELARQTCLSVRARDPQRVAHLPVVPGSEEDLAEQLRRGESWLVGRFGTDADWWEWFLPVEDVHVELVPGCHHAGQSTMWRDLPRWLGLMWREERVFDLLYGRAPLGFALAVRREFVYGVLRDDTRFLLLVDVYERQDPQEIADRIVARAHDATVEEVQASPAVHGWPVLRLDKPVTQLDLDTMSRQLQYFLDDNPEAATYRLW